MAARVRQKPADGPAPRPRLTRRRVIDAAFALVEEHGVEHLSMRTLGASLGVEGMAIYRHVRDKDDLLDAVAARLLEELDLSAARRPRQSWQQVVRRMVDAWVALADGYPHSFPLLYRDRPPTALDLQPAELVIGSLLAAGFSPPQAARAYRTVNSFVDGVLLGRSISGYDPETDLWHHVPAELIHGLPAVRAARSTLVGLTGDKVITHGVRALLLGIERIGSQTHAQS